MALQPLDGGSARRRAATYTQNSTNRINARRHPCLEWGSALLLNQIQIIYVDPPCCFVRMYQSSMAYFVYFHALIFRTTFAVWNIFETRACIYHVTKWLTLMYSRLFFLFPTEVTVFLLRICFCRHPKILTSPFRGEVTRNLMPASTVGLFMSYWSML
jgi:hypothetical protein